MNIAVVKESKAGECRVALSPDVAAELIAKGYDISIEQQAGINSYFSDADYEKVGVKIVSGRIELIRSADIILSVNAPDLESISHMKSSAVLISFMWAAYHPELVKACEAAGISAFSMDAVPRISRAQKMDALSSQSNLAGYKTVLLGANALGKIFPLLMTAAGTVKPARVMIMGAGVAGLQAIATAKRLGAVVEVSDIRPETKEQVESLGAKFIQVEQDESIKTEGGYVKNVSEEFLRKQQALIAKHAAEADLIITTALIPGKKAPVLITEEMVKSMKMGSVIVDMAVEQGGNCALSELDKTVVKHGVTIIGESNLPSMLPMNASQLYAKNLAALLIHLSDKDGFKWELDEEITKGSLIIHQGKRVHASII
ncbi:MAG: Re/Si-specific NAD(P)(+) transhydrogenase subunit alpha [Flavobacteriales bacterium]